MASLTLTDVTLGYDRHPAVHHVSGTIAAGEMLAVIGPNGAGKSTLLKGMAGLLRPLSGDLVLRDCARADVAYLPQAADLDRAFPITVYDLVSMGRWKHLGLFGGLSRQDRQAVMAALASVGLAGFEHRPIGTLSGGQQQRALFARLLLQDARVILLDEPFAAIDEGTVADLLAIIHRWRDEGRMVVAVLHDFALVRRHFSRVLLLARETIAWGPTEEVMQPVHLDRARRMPEAFDDHAHVCDRPDAA